MMEGKTRAAAGKGDNAVGRTTTSVVPSDDTNRFSSTAKAAWREKCRGTRGHDAAGLGHGAAPDAAIDSFVTRPFRRDAILDQAWPLEPLIRSQVTACRVPRTIAALKQTLRASHSSAASQSIHMRRFGKSTVKVRMSRKTGMPTSTSQWTPTNVLRTVSRTSSPMPPVFE